ncbi:MAG TPA: response regulator [Ktedonobacterales bacterium]
MAHSRPSDDTRPGNGPRVLIVEDDRAIREIVTLVLTEGGYRVRATTEPEQALDALRHDVYDVVITDLFGRTATSGLEATRHLVETAAPTPVGVCTGHHLSADSVRANGFAFMISKPFDVDELLATLAEQVGA